MKKLLAALCCLALTLPALAQDEQVQGFVHEQSKANDYIWPTDPQVLEKLLSTGKTVKYTVKGDQVTVTLPKGTPQESLAFMFQIKK